MQREPKRTAFTRLERGRQPPPPLPPPPSERPANHNPVPPPDHRNRRHNRQPPEVIAENILDMIVLMQLFRLIMEIHYSSGVDLDTLFEALEQLFEPQPIDPNMFNPTEPKIHLPASVASGASRPLQRHGRAAVARRASATGEQRVPDSGASACRQVSASVTPAATRSPAVESPWMIRSTPKLSAATLSSCAVRPPSLALASGAAGTPPFPVRWVVFHG